MDSQNNITFEASFYAETDKAICILCIRVEDSWTQKEWFPKKLTWWMDDGGYKKLKVTVPKWMLEKKGLIDKVKIYEKT